MLASSGLIAVFGATSAAAAYTPGSILLGSGWQVAADPADRGLTEDWARGGGAPPWVAVQVPHVAVPTPLEEHFGGTVTWYRLAFTGPATGPDSNWFVRFEQARRATRAWLNGTEIGANDDPYVPFEFEASGLRPGELNHLVVRVDNRKRPELREGWWNWGGLTRPVWLVPRGRVVLRELGLLSRVTCVDCPASVLVDGALTNHAAAPVEPVVEVALRAPDGVVSQRAWSAGPLAPGATVRLKQVVAVNGPPVLWWPHRPNRYRATVTVRLGNDTVHQQQLWIGLRSVTVSGGRLRINGRAVRLRGASIHEDVLGRGAAITASDVDWIGRELTALGVDITRSHYALSERLLTRMDELGILVWSQAPIYHRDDLLKTPQQRASALATVRGTVLATRNHPSVITHSVANELSSYADAEAGTAAFLRDARGLTRQLDPTLPLSVDVMGRPGIVRQRAYAAFDLLGVNAYFGWYRGPPRRPTASVSQLKPYLHRLRAQYPRQGLVMTEFGAEAIARGPERTKGTYEFQARYVDRVLDIADRSSELSGAVYWTLREFAVKPRWYGGGAPPGTIRDGIHNKGLVTYDGRRKPAWYVAKRMFRRMPLFVRPRAPTPR